MEGEVTGAIHQGLLVLLGVGPNDTADQAKKLADKIVGLRIFTDEGGKMNLNLSAVGGSLLVISQFTLFADAKSRRPSFTGAAKPDLAIPLYETFLEACTALGFPPQRGVFGAHMDVASVNDGPVTLVLDTDLM